MNEIWVTVVGNVSSEVTQRRTANDGRVVSFRIMSTERRFDRVTGAWVDGGRFSARVSCWRRLGENVLASIEKGDPVVVRGRLSEREYETDGVRRWSNEITASSVGADLMRSTAEVTRAGATQAAGDAAGDASASELLPTDVTALPEAPSESTDEASDPPTEVFALRPGHDDRSGEGAVEDDDAWSTVTSGDAMAS